MAGGFAERVTVRCGRGLAAVTAVAVASISVGPGQRVGLAGPSSSGKSTQAALLEVFNGWRADDGIGVLLISHDWTLLTYWCDQVLEIAELSWAG